MKKQFILKISKALAVLTGAVLIFLLSDMYVTYAEGTVDLSIETKEININDIPADRKVYLAINLDNDPDADRLGLLIQADSRLITRFGELCRSNKYNVSFGDYSTDPHVESIDVFLTDNCDNSGNVAELCFYLPDNCAPGDFYEIAFTNEIVKSCQICYGNLETGWHYGFESFGRLTSGGIRITGDTQAPEPPQVQNNEPAQNVQQPEAPPASENPSANPSQTEQQTENTETSEITSTVSETGSSVSVSTAESSDTIKKSVTTDELLITEYYGETESFIPEEPDHKENNNKSYLIYILIIAGAAAAAGAVIFIINKEKKKS